MPAQRRTPGQSLGALRRRVGRMVSRRPAPATQDTPDQRLRALLATARDTGQSPTEAYVSAMRELVGHKRYGQATRLVAAGKGDARFVDGARIGAAILAVRRGHHQLAAAELAEVPRGLALLLAPAEVVGSELATDRAKGLATADDLLGGAPGDLTDAARLDLARQAFGHQEFDLSARFLASRSEAATTGSDAAWLAEWVARARSDHRPEPTPPGRLTFALIDYKQPDLGQTSANVGDYVQTLAGLGHLVRHQGLTFAGDAELARAASELQARVRPELRLSGIEREVDLITVNRDATSLDVVPEGTWMLAFGWYMHDWFEVHWDFPFNPNLRPIFVSFHINKPRILTPDGVAALKAAAPIGCRDWTTVRLLTEHGVPAFFSGCLTTTVGTVFPGDPSAPASGPTAFVDLLPGSEPTVSTEVVRVHHSDPAVRRSPFVPNLQRAVEVLERYRTDFPSVVTSRLHCYLPVRALGVPVDFRPKNPQDIRFDGLAPLDDAGFAAMQEALRTKLQAVMSEILVGSDEATVREVWATVCADDVAVAARRTGGITT